MFDIYIVTFQSVPNTVLCATMKQNAMSVHRDTF